MASRSHPPHPRRRWRRWSPDDAREALTAWRDSGLGLAEYAKSAGVSSQRLRRWAERVDALPTIGRLLPVVVTSPAPRSTLVVRLAEHVVVEISDVDTTTAEWVADLAVGLARRR